MLPPFVPPYAREVILDIPLITDFCVEKERSFSGLVLHQETQQIALAEEYVPPIINYVIDAGSSLLTVPLPSSAWLEEERDSFDWQSIALLAKQQKREQQSGKEEGIRNWARPARSIAAAEYVATILIQVARRVRTGELKVEATRGVRTEAALAATLAALLKE